MHHPRGGVPDLTSRRFFGVGSLGDTTLTGVRAILGPLFDDWLSSPISINNSEPNFRLVDIGRYIARRLLLAVFVLLGVLVITFVISHSFGDPIYAWLGKSAALHPNLVKL